MSGKARNVLTFTYTNWRGETSVRHVDADSARFYTGSTEWHPERQMLLGAWDADKGAHRDFAVRDIVFDQPADRRATAMRKLPYTFIDRDLNDLAAERVIEALQSVVQLASSRGQAFTITAAAHSAIMGAMAGAYDAWQGNAKASDPTEVAIALLEAAREARANTGGDNAG